MATADLPEFLTALAEAALVPPPRPDTDRRADDDALAVLDDLAADSVRVRRVLERARGERPRRSVATRDYAAVLDRADGRLALFSWGSGGVDLYGWRGHLVDGRPVDVWRWDQLAEVRGDPPVTVDHLARATLRDELAGADPTVVLRTRTAMPPLAEYEHHAGGDA